MFQVCVLCAAESAPTPGDITNECVHNVLCSKALLSSCRLMPTASFIECIYLIFGLSLFFCLVLSPELLSFPPPKPPPFYDVPEIRQLQFCHFSPQRCFSLNLSEDILVCLSGGPSNHSALL